MASSPGVLTSSNSSRISCVAYLYHCGVGGSLSMSFLFSFLNETNIFITIHVWGSLLSRVWNTNHGFLVFVNWLFTPWFWKKFIIKRIKRLCVQALFEICFQEPLLLLRTRAKITLCRNVGMHTQLCRGNIWAEAGAAQGVEVQLPLG